VPFLKSCGRRERKNTQGYLVTTTFSATAEFVPFLHTRGKRATPQFHFKGEHTYGIYLAVGWARICVPV
jgi:hypothetical protein